MVPSGTTTATPAPTGTTSDTTAGAQLDRRSVASTHSSMSEMEEFLTPGATALEVRHRTFCIRALVNLASLAVALLAANQRAALSRLSLGFNDITVIFASVQDEERLVEQLLALGMGFARKDCEAAALRAGGNLQVAVDLLIG